ncbi:hypothetical protein GLOIN_2v1801976 [Rhizophagus irregularis DAOM 181602=DAOM 197198]|nr:hypothetical protein GLOIN_2v1801976 [Rhizophagus irregularis DAOM 181602=DAOM 197198]
MTLSYLTDDSEILQLKEQLEVNQINNINIDEEHKPLFEYPKYLENYNDFGINSTIRRYCSGLSISHSKIIRLNGTTNNEVGQEFLRNIADVSLNLRQLIINLNQRSRRLLINPTTSNNLIDKTTWKKLYKIIQGQNKLKIFKLWNCSSSLNNILSSLEFQKHSLVHIEFNNTNFVNVSLKSFNNLYNLECLIFEYCEGLLLNQCEILNFASFKLKEISFIRDKWNIDITPSIIKYLGEPLQRLSVENLTIPLIENISLYCPNLILLKIGIYSHIDFSGLAFFKDLRAKMLNITIFYDIDKFFRKLANNVPINVSV